MKRLTIILSLALVACVCISAPRKARRRLLLAGSGGFSPLSLNPLVWYKGDGDTVDASGNDYTGTWRGSASYTNGINGQAFNFGANRSAVLSGSAEFMNLTNGTVCFWFMPKWANTDGIDHFFFDAIGGSDRRFICYKDTTGKIRIYTDSVQRGSYTQSITAYEWIFVTIIYGDNKLYINNSLAYDYPDGGLGLGADTLVIGDRKSISNLGLDSAMDDFMIFNTILTANEITQVYEWRE